MGDEQVSHVDIYHKLGTLEGKMDAMIGAISERKAELDGLFSRMRDLESKLAWVLGAAAMLSVVVPLVITMTAPRIHFNQEGQATQVR